jgi:hypothetical protein
VGNFFIILGISAFFMVWWFSLLVSLMYFIYYERIIFAEEEFLRKKFGDVFEQWAAATPFIIPDFRKWKSPELTFSLRTVIKREYSGLLGISILFFVLDLSGDYCALGKIEWNLGWLLLLLFSLIVYISALILKKKTRFLHIPGR